MRTRNPNGTQPQAAAGKKARAKGGPSKKKALAKKKPARKQAPAAKSRVKALVTGFAPLRRPVKLPDELRDLNKLVQIDRAGGNDFKIVDPIQQNAIFARTMRMWNGLSPKRQIGLLRQMLTLRELPLAERVAGFVELGKQYGTLRGELDTTHATRDWLSGWFSMSAVDVFLGASIIAAQRCLQAGVPVGMYWVAGAGAELKISIAESEHQVTFLVMTPPVPATQVAVRELDTAESLWVVSAAQNGAVRASQIYATALA